MKFEELLQLRTITNFSPDEQVASIGKLIDLSFDNNSLTGIKHAFKLNEQIAPDTLNASTYTIWQYYIANGWGCLRKLKYQDTSDDWNFQMSELGNEIIHLRKAIASSGFNEIQKERQCQIYTNLANAFSYIGRFVEAQDFWNKALEVLPGFSMALGNKAMGLVYYGQCLFDTIHSNLFKVYAYHLLNEALQHSHPLERGAEEGMKKMHSSLYKYIVNNFPEEYLKGYPDLNYFDLGKEELKSYRLFCLNHKLYINPLNDLGNYSVACHDCLNLPTLFLPASRAPVYIDLYNQIRQEFGTARYSYFIACSRGVPHFSDIDVPIVSTLEPLSYSYYIEHMKISFRLAYSILDKIAYLLNDYLKLQIEQHKISFRSIWYANSNRTQLRPFFHKSQNWALRGLYWLSKDLYEKDNGFDTVLEPSAMEIATIRNFIEHKGFKVFAEPSFFKPNFEEQDISYTTSRAEFERKTTKLLQLTRAAIMYLALAVSHEEKGRDYSTTKSFNIPGKLLPIDMRI